jgi:uncharacterized protein YacL
MKIFKFIGWLMTAISLMIVGGANIHMTFAQLFPLLDIDGNRATAGGYTMEIIVGAIAFVLVFWRILWALERVNTFNKLWPVIKTRAAILSFSLAGLIAMVFTNRLFWWMKHMFTADAYNYSTYTGAANSLLMSFLMCVLVYATNADPEIEDKKSGISSGLSIAVSLWGIGILAFVLGLIIYPGRDALG